MSAVNTALGIIKTVTVNGDVIDVTSIGHILDPFKWLEALNELLAELGYESPYDGDDVLTSSFTGGVGSAISTGILAAVGGTVLDIVIGSIFD